MKKLQIILDRILKIIIQRIFNNLSFRIKIILIRKSTFFNLYALIETYGNNKIVTKVSIFFSI